MRDGVERGAGQGTGKRGNDYTAGKTTLELGAVGPMAEMQQMAAMAEKKVMLQSCVGLMGKQAGL